MIRLGRVGTLAESIDPPLRLQGLRPISPYLRFPVIDIWQQVAFLLFSFFALLNLHRIALRLRLLLIFLIIGIHLLEEKLSTIAGSRDMRWLSGGLGKGLSDNFAFLGQIIIRGLLLGTFGRMFWSEDLDMYDVTDAHSLLDFDLSPFCRVLN